jgi:ABC-type multidrug transport system ATPase subunit
VPALASFDGLVKRFGSITAVEGLSFEVPEGTVCGLLGPNGAGKTTSICALLGLASPTEGITELLGARPGSPGFPAAIRQVGALIEGPALYSRASARQNLEIEAAAGGHEASRGQIAELLALVGLDQRADSRAGKFSHGMKQRLGLAQALLGSPKLVVLDEPTNGLDPAGIVEIRDLIRRLPERGTTVLLSSHLLAEVQLMCDRVSIINRGRLVADGTMQKLLATGGAAGFVVVVAPEESARALEVLQGAGLDARPQEDGSLSAPGVVDGEALNRALAEAGIYASELRPTEARLEEVFLSLTGEPGHAG